MLTLTLICLSMNGVFADSSVDVNLNSTQSEIQSINLDDFSVSDSNVISNVILDGSDMGVCEKGNYFEVSLSDLNNKPLTNETIIKSHDGILTFPFIIKNNCLASSLDNPKISESTPFK